MSKKRFRTLYEDLELLAVHRLVSHSRGRLHQCVDVLLLKTMQ